MPRTQFQFDGVPPGQYTLHVSPQCNPFGCRHPTVIQVVGMDIFVLIPAVSKCVGDCASIGSVAVTDILTCVNIALGDVPLDSCLACDPHLDFEVTVDELVAGVNNVLAGCSK